MNIWHVCCVDGNQANGMNVVIPCYAIEQSKTENVVLLNLSDYYLENIKDVTVFNVEDLKREGIKGLINKAIKPDLIVYHGIYVKKVLKFYYKYNSFKIPYIVVPHGSMVHDVQKRNRLKKIIFNWLIVYHFTRGASAVQFLSKREQHESNIKFYKKSYVAGNGIYPQKKRYKAKNSNDIKIVYIGRMDLHLKGLDLLLEACINKKEYMQSNNIFLHIYGPERNDAKKYMSEIILKNDIGKYVIIHDGVFGKEKENVLLNADYFIQTSRTEGMPMGILEALSYGIPLLVTEGTTVGEIVEKYRCGIVVPTTVTGIERLIEKSVECMPNRDEMSKGALQSAENFYWDNITEKTLQEYKKILKADIRRKNDT